MVETNTGRNVFN